MGTAAPLVTIAIPTFNRAATLPRALDSALAQTHTDLEVLVSDNASTDATEEIGREYVARDERVRYLRRPVNIGPTANLNGLFAAGRGRFTQTLADDDWLDSGCVAACLAELEARPDHAVVGARARYWRGEDAVSTAVDLQLGQERGADRALAYFGAVEDNGTFYGLIHTEALRRAAPMPNVLGNDLVLVGALAFQGKIATLDTVAVHRDAGGTSADLAKIVRTLGAGRWQERLPHLTIAAAVARDVAWGGVVYRELPPAERVALALRCANAVMDWTAQAWYLSDPLIAAFEAHDATRWVARGYRRLERQVVARRRRERAERRDYFEGGAP
ncbi:MAG: glycosyltransferase [Actinomycetota bacterium]|nr:glycosyltransferase [Actinomycetota bacterium]